MGDIGGFWEDGARASDRLARWCRDLASSKRREDRGDRALQALTDVGVLRRVLGQVEFEAIQVGRQEGRSWAEIAVRLGITRQSAWERWQDIDRVTSTPVTPEPATPAARAISMSVEEAVFNRTRRRSTVVVPNVVGQTRVDAHLMLEKVGLIATSSDPFGEPLDVVTSPGDVVSDQSPESGAAVPPRTLVRLWFDRDGGSGVREPRRPRPEPKVGRKMLDSPSDSV